MNAHAGVHQHGPHTAGFHSASRRSLWLAFGLIASFMAVEFAGGLLANSLALLADAGHMLTDAAALGLALAAVYFAARPASRRRTYGFYRTEVLAALANALGLWAIAGWIIWEAFQRLNAGAAVDGPAMLLIGALGLGVNVAAAVSLHRSSGESLNVEGAWLHVLGDLMGSVGVVAAGVLVVFFGWQAADPVIAMVIALLVIATSARLLWKVMHVLMEGTPSHLDLEGLCSRLEREPGVGGVHDIHAWSVTSGYDVFSAHVTTTFADMDEAESLLRRLREIAAREFGIAHVTIQLEFPCGEPQCLEQHHAVHV